MKTIKTASIHNPSIAQYTGYYSYKNIAFIKLFEQFFFLLQRDTLSARAFKEVRDACGDALADGSTNTTFRSLADLEATRGYSPCKQREYYFSVGNKLGLFQKINKQIHTCPFLMSETSSKRYEDVLYYYENLFPEVYHNITSSTFKDGILTLDELKEYAVNQFYKEEFSYNTDDLEGAELEQLNLPSANTRTWQDFYDIAFNSSIPKRKDQRTLKQEEDFVFKQAITSTYRNAANEIMKVLAYVHSRMLEELLPIYSEVSYKSTRKFYFRDKLPTGFKVSKFTTCDFYQELLTAPPTIEEALEHIDSDEIISTLQEQIESTVQKDDFSDLLPTSNPQQEELKQKEVDSKVKDFFSTLDSFESPSCSKKLTLKEVEESDYKTWLSFEEYNKRHSSIVMDDQHRKFLQRYKAENNKL